jgi:hypothetical protein
VEQLPPISHSIFGYWSRLMEPSARGNTASPKRTVSQSLKPKKSLP